MSKKPGRGRRGKADNGFVYDPDTDMSLSLDTARAVNRAKMLTPKRAKGAGGKKAVVSVAGSVLHGGRLYYYIDSTAITFPLNVGDKITLTTHPAAGE